MAGIFDFGISIIGNEMARRREEEARQQNYWYGERAAENADKRTRALYEDYQSPEALLRQYKNAGLSPSLMFGGSGVGGQSMPNGAQSNGAAGISPNTMPLNGLNAAQTELMLAEADLKREQAKEYRGENEMGEAKLNEIRQTTATSLDQAGFYKAEAAYKGLMSDYQKIVNGVSEQTTKDQIRKIVAEADKTESQSQYWDRMAELTNLEFEFQDETYQDRVNTIKENLNNIIANTVKAYSESDLNETKINEIQIMCELAYMQYLQRAQEIMIMDKEANAKLEMVRVAWKQLIQENLKAQLSATLQEMNIEAGMINTMTTAITNTISTAAGATIFGAFKAPSNVPTKKGKK